MPLLLDGGPGEDKLRVQSIFEETFFKGGDETGSTGGGVDGDEIDLNVNIITLQPVGPAEVVADVLVATIQQVVPGPAPGGKDEVQRVTLQDTTGGTFTLTFGAKTTTPLHWDAPETTVDKALEALDGDASEDDDDFGVKKVGDVYEITFFGDYASTNVAQLTGDASSLRSNGINALVTVDGEGGNDVYRVNLVGGETDALINILDSGTAGTDGDVPPATADFDSLTVYGTDNLAKGDVFLLRAATSDKGLAFIALLNAPDPHDVQAPATRSSA